MEKLTNDQILFIENYLKNSGVEYLDIRLEMTDHVASEIETRMAAGDSRGFYLIFREYMISHKAGLLGSLKNFRKEADKKVSLKVVRNFVHPKTLLLTSLFTIILYRLLQTFEVDPVNVQWYFILMVLGIYFVPYTFFGKKQYLYLNRLSLKFGFVVYAMYLIYKYVPFLQDHSLWYFAGLILVNVSVYKTFLELVTHYKKNYKLS